MADKFIIVQKKKLSIGFTLTFHVNDSGGNTFTEDVVLGETYSSLLDNPPSWDGYYFDGWYLESDFSGQRLKKTDHINYFKTDIYGKWVSMIGNCTELNIQTSSANQTIGICSLTKSSSSEFVYIDWGDGTNQTLTASASKLQHVYSLVGSYSIRINDSISNIRLGNSDYYSYGQGIKGIVSLGNSYVQPTAFSTYEFAGVGFENLSSLDLFTSITALPNYCFYHAKIQSLENMPSRITSLGNYCFSYCTNLTSLTGLGTGLTTIPSYCFQYSGITSLNGTHSGITSLQQYAFDHCQSLTDLTGLGSGGFTALPNYCFNYCTGLRSTATLPSKITSLGEHCFERCSSLVNLSGIKSTMSLGTYCFYYCTALANLSTLPARTSLPSNCFQYCTGLTSVTLGSSFTSLGTICFSNCTSLQTVDLSQSGINSLPNYCFNQCTSLKSITFKSQMNGSIGDYCFYYCYNSSFTEIEIPEGVTSLGSNCFRYCYNLKTVTLPSTCTSLGTYCFAGCRQIKDLTCNRTSAPTTSTYTFGSSTSTGINTYTGYTTRGSNTLWVPSGNSGYNSGLWLNPLQNSSQCGFTKKVIGGEEEDWGDGEREYLESDGKAAINTGIQPILNSTKMIAQFCPGNCTGNVFFGMSPNQTGSDSTDFRFFMYTDNYVYWDYDGQRMQKTNASVGMVKDLTTWYRIECANGVFKVNDTSYSIPTATGTVGTGTIYIGRDVDNSTDSSVFKVRNFKVYNGDTLVGNFVPWVKDGVPCMYDTVTQQFFYNAHSSGSFKAGPPMTDGQKLWIKSTGTQYISTDYIPESSTSFNTQYAQISSQYSFAPVAYSGDSYNASNTFGFAINGGTGINSYFGTVYNLHVGNNKIAYNQPIIVHFRRGNNNIEIENIVTKQTDSASFNTASYTTGTRTLYLFNGNTTTTDLTHPASLKMFYFDIFNNSDLIHNYVPYVLDHVPCMYDTVTSSYFYNKGTGEFIPGPSTTPDESHVSAYVQNGLCVLYDGIENAGTGIHDPEALFWYNHANGNNDGLMKSDTKWTKNSFQNSSNGKPCEIQDTGVRDLIATKTFTLEFLVKPSRTGTREGFFSNYNGSNNAVWIEHNSGSYSNGAVRVGLGGSPDFYSAKTVLADETAFITITSTQSQHKIYKNGILDATNNTSWTAAVNSDKFVVGGEQNRDYMAFYGNYHLLHLYNRVLTDEEILSNYQTARDFYGMPVPVTRSFNFLSTDTTSKLQAINYTNGSYVEPKNKSFSIWAKNGSLPPHGEFFKFSSLALGYGDSRNMDNAGNYIWILYEVVSWNAKWLNSSPDQNWHHYCITISSTGLPIVYMDGIKVLQGNAQNFNTTGTNYNIAGGSNRHYNGNLTRFCVFNKTLTAAEVMEDYALRNEPPTNSSIMHYVPMTMKDSIVKDYVGNYDMKVEGSATQSTDIPPPYDARIEYLKYPIVSTGQTGPYINTEIIPDTNTKLEMKLANVTGNLFFFGERSSVQNGNYNRNCYFIGLNASGQFFYGFGQDRVEIALPDYSSNKTYVIIKDGKNHQVYDGETLVYSGQNTSTSLTAEHPLFLFTANDGGNALVLSNTNQQNQRHYYYVKIWQNSSLVRDFIPVRCSNTGFMYDQVSGKLFGNSGTGSFVLGPDVQS